MFKYPLAKISRRALTVPGGDRDATEFIVVMGRHSHLQIAMLVLMPLVTKARHGYIGGQHVNANAAKCGRPRGLRQGDS